MSTLSVPPATDRHHEAARRLLSAERDRTPCAPIRDVVPHATIDDAYLIQSLVREAAGGHRRHLGRKIGLTSAAVQGQLGVDQPDFGTLHADMAFGHREPVPGSRLLQPRIEAEVAFVLGRDLPHEPVTTTDVIRATDFVVAAIEIVDSRIRDWDINIVDTIADNASSGLFVLGGRPRRLYEMDDLATVGMTLQSEGTTLSSGVGTACLGHPINAVVWLANTLAARGAPLQEGELVLSGALGPLVPAQTGRRYEATIEGLGSVAAHLVQE